MIGDVKNKMDIAFEGMVGHSFHKQVDSAICDENLGIAFGRVVSQDDTGTKVKLPLSTDTEVMFAGVTKHINKVPNGDGSVKYNKTELVNKVVKGSIFVYCSEAFDTNDSVYVRHTAGAGASEKVGMVKTTATDGTLWTKARFKNKGVAGELAELDINLP